MEIYPNQTRFTWYFTNFFRGFEGRGGARPHAPDAAQEGGEISENNNATTVELG